MFEIQNIIGMKREVFSPNNCQAAKRYVRYHIDTNDRRIRDNLKTCSIRDNMKDQRF